jgi:hypothetical protein
MGEEAQSNEHDARKTERRTGGPQEEPGIDFSIDPSETDNSFSLPPQKPHSAGMLHLQKTIGNAAVSRMVVQRQGHPGHHDSPTRFPSFDDFHLPTAPVEANWDVPPTPGATDLAPGWGDVPNFPNGYDAHEATPELDRGKVRFQNDWSMAANSWNAAAALAQRFNVHAMLPDAYASSIGGQPVQPPTEMRAPDADNARPMGRQSVGSSFNAQNQLDVTSRFNPASLRGPDRTLYDTKMTASVTARNTRTAKQIVVDSKMTEVGNALSRARQAQIRQRQAQTGEQRTDVQAERTSIDREQAQVTAIIGAAQAVLTAGVQRDVSSGIAAVGALTSVYYNDRIAQIESRMSELDRTLARLQTSLAVEDVVQARNAVRTAINEVRIAITDMDTAAQQEVAAFNDLSQTLETLARHQGLSAEDARTVATAAAALPIIDETIGKLSQIEAALQVPTYTRDSGIGAGLVTNLQTFRDHLGTLKGFQQNIGQLKQQWTARRSGAEAGTGVPGQTAGPSQ